MSEAVTHKSRGKLVLPLLTKELAEQAARKRTYVIRVIYAGLLYAIACVGMYEVLGNNRNLMNVLGSGDELLYILLVTQVCGIYIFLPALMCGVITQEREKDSLILLLLTDIGPWELLLEKYLSRLIPMIYFLLLVIPAMAVAYSLGGIEADDVINGTLMLLVTCIQVGAIGLACSAYFRSTTAAFIATYLLGASMYGLPILLALPVSIITDTPIDRVIDEEVAFMFLPIFWFFEGMGDWAELSVGYGIGLGSAVFAFLAARYWVIRRAQLRPRNGLLVIFKWLDQLFHRANRVTGGVVLYKSKEELPGDEPVVWWELTKRAVGQPQYLLRIFSVFMIPVITITALAVLYSRHYGRQNAGLSSTLFLVWPVALLLMIVQSANLFAIDRSRQTLDVLLTTPMSGKEILRQKTAALRRLNWVLLIPLAMLIGTEVWWETWPWTRDNGLGEHNFYRAVRYLYCAAGLALISFPLVAWISIWIGMRIKSQLRAIIVALLVILAWFVGWPVLVVTVYEIFDLSFMMRSNFHEYMCGSPIFLVGLNEFEELDKIQVSELPLITCYLGVLFAFYQFVRWRCMCSVDRLLGRVTS